ncbi:hypothetical protein D0Z66_18650 [Cereibacter sphaeroides]|nr:hypothetical protein D0Z66_18650 [Cereibacter sphaeroides]
MRARTAAAGPPGRARADRQVPVPAEAVAAGGAAARSIPAAPAGRVRRAEPPPAVGAEAPVLPARPHGCAARRGAGAIPSPPVPGSRPADRVATADRGGKGRWSPIARGARAAGLRARCRDFGRAPSLRPR